MDAKVNDANLADEQPDFESTGESAPAEIEVNAFEQELARPIQAHGQEITVLKWREPTAGDLEYAGVPITVDFFTDSGKPTVSFNEKKMSAMISRLCQVPPSSVSQLAAGDWHGIAWKLVRFFMPRMAG
jgi:hypothetical protein